MARVEFAPKAAPDGAPEAPPNAALPPSLQQAMGSQRRSRGTGWFVAAVLIGLLSAAVLVWVSGRAPYTAGLVSQQQVLRHYTAVHTGAIVGLVAAGLMLIVGIVRRVRSNQSTA